MQISVKYALDAQNNVGVYTADLKPGDMSVIFREEKADIIYQVSLMNENGILYVRVVDPDRANKGEPVKIRKEARANEVFNVGTGTIMIMSIQGATEAKHQPQTQPQMQPQPQVQPKIEAQPNISSEAPPPLPTVKVESEKKEENAVSQIGPDPDSQVFEVDQGKTQGASEAVREVKHMGNPFPQDGDKNTFIKSMDSTFAEVDPSSLPPVEGAKLQFNYQHPEEENKSKLGEGKDSKLNVIAPKKEEAPEKKRVRTDIRPKSREQLFIEDVRDRRFYLKGARYSMRNKISALVLVLGLFGIGLYSIGVSQMAERSQDMVFSDSVRSQTFLRAQELRTRMKAYNTTLGSLIHAVSQLNAENLAKNYGVFDFIVSAGAFKFHRAKDVESTYTTSEASKLLDLTLPQKKLVTIPNQPEPISTATKLDVNKMYRLEDGNYLEPIVQWVKESEAVALKLEYNSVLKDQVKRVTDILSRRSGLTHFDPGELAFPQEENGLYTYVVQEHPMTFIVVQASSRYIADIFQPTNGVDYFLISNRSNILFPEVARTNSELLTEIKKQFGDGHTPRTPASENHFLTSIPITTGLDLIGRPSDFKTISSQSDSKMFIIYGAVVLVIFLFAGVVFARNISAPLNSLVHHIEGVAAGDYHRRFNIESNDEIGQVADYFEYLTQTLKRKEQTLAVVTDLASKDDLTSLYNHRYFRSQLEKKWKEIEGGKGGSLILIDIDNFKIFNVAHGHIQGDTVLKELSETIQEVVKNSGLIARYGGEEIIIWMAGFDQKASFDLSERLLNKIREMKIHNLTGGTPFNITCSLGVTTYIKGRHINIDKFLVETDANLLMAKKAGKNRIWAGSI